MNALMPTDDSYTNRTCRRSRRWTGEARFVITERGLRVVHALTATVVAALILLVAGAPGNPRDGDTWLELSADEAVVAAPCPSPSSVALATASPGRLAAARDGSFEVFGPRRVELRVPIDWTTDPLRRSPVSAEPPQAALRGAAPGELRDHR